MSDISSLADMPNIEYINISYTNVSDISALTNMLNLSTIDISRNNIDNIDVLKSNVNLNILILDEGQVSEEKLQALKNELQNLNIIIGNNLF